MAPILTKPLIRIIVQDTNKAWTTPRLHSRYPTAWPFTVNCTEHSSKMDNMFAIIAALFVFEEIKIWNINVVDELGRPQPMTKRRRTSYIWVQRTSAAAEEGTIFTFFRDLPNKCIDSWKWTGPWPLISIIYWIKGSSSFLVQSSFNRWHELCSDTWNYVDQRWRGNDCNRYHFDPYR